MKPTKNKVYCKDCGRSKMVFESEKKANTFIMFNSEDIESESGYSPNRSYHCILCDGWHVTSRNDNLNIKSRTERVIELYTEKKELEKEKGREKQLAINKRKKEELNKIIETIEDEIKVLDVLKDYGRKDNCVEILNTAFAELDTVNKFIGIKKIFKKRICEIEDKLNYFRMKIYSTERRNF
ncbi:MAG: hypothetical protein WAT71_11495 [Ignavibacteria bacterium]